MDVFDIDQKNKKQPLIPSIDKEVKTYSRQADETIEIFSREALGHALQMVNAHAGSLFLWDEFRKELVLRAHEGPYPIPQVNRSVKLQDGILGRTGCQGLSVLVRNIERDERFRSLQRLGRYRSGSFMSISLVAHNRLIGVLNITERENLVPFEEKDFLRIKTLAHYMALSLDQLRQTARFWKENEKLHQCVSLLEREIKTQEPLAAVGKLAANLTHELNGPLDSIRRYVNLAFNQAAEDSLGRAYLLKARKGIRRAVHVIRGLLHFSKELPSGGARTTEIHDLLADTLDRVFSNHSQYESIEVVKELASKSIYVQDRGLEIVFENLFRNACQAMQGEGVLRLKTTLRDGKIWITVEDTGCGIQEGIPAEKIFDPFFTTRSEQGGMGVGLSLCRQIVEKCGGTIQVCNRTTRGTCFTVALPELNSL